MSLVTGIITADSLSDAWLGAAQQLAGMPGHSAVHLVTRISQPMTEDAQVRTELDRILDARGLQSTATVANTLFPAALAERHPEPAELAERYRSHILPRIRRLAGSKNSRGTYFGRLVAYPDAVGTQIADQLTNTVTKLRCEATLPGPLSSCYELAVHSPGEDGEAEVDHGRDLISGTPALTYHGHRDSRIRMGFPCLSFLSFHLDRATLHLTAHYRNQLFLERAYGNYLGLGGLLGYVAKAAGLSPGELLVVAGHAHLEAVVPLRPLLSGHQPLPLDLEGTA